MSTVFARLVAALLPGVITIVTALLKQPSKMSTVFARSDATATKSFTMPVPEVTNWVIEDRCQFLLANCICVQLDRFLLLVSQGMAFSSIGNQTSSRIAGSLPSPDFIPRHLWCDLWCVRWLRRAAHFHTSISSFPYFAIFISILRYFHFHTSLFSFPYFAIFISILSFLHSHFRFPNTQLEDLATNILCYAINLFR